MFDLFGIVFPIVFFMVFVMVLGTFIMTMARGLSTWNKNNHSPRLTVEAAVTAKHVHVTHHRHANGGDITGAHGFTNSSSTKYFVTFQVESGDRMELSVSGPEYGMLAEGDTGRLSFQGTRYLGFERD